MSTDDKKHFDALVDRILTSVVEACPAQVDLGSKTSVIETAFNVEDVAKGVEAAEFKKNHLEDTLQWLVAEGFIRAGSSTDHYVATLQSLKLYDAIPSTLKR
ncbi:hypothetical protein BK672_08070 [Pseudomonas fluorescens]|jgi:methionine synthase I (cobalamin-dependent)|uniref:Uncharacterized protein n=1 Tax=Pseudomonas fluorescens TaxID=294 RepID=A0A423NE13_PSEFL|nr:hypothetical protein [Pseudomonas fluorescens]RON96511.1 hypothetical protein BK672_08070 [Pseudomonas fluorescens]